MSWRDYVKGTDQLSDLIEKLEKLQQAFADEAHRRVKEYTPVDTGLLANSWKVTVEGSNITIENTATTPQGVYYGPFVEFGTIHMRGFFMATRTIAEATQILAVAKQKVGL